MKQRNSFIFVKTFRDAIEDLEIQDKCIMYETIITYGLEGIEPVFDKKYLLAIWKLIKKDIDMIQLKYDASVENGRKGGRPKKPNNNPTETQLKPDGNHENKIKENKIKENKIEEKENRIKESLIELDFGRFNDL